MAKKRVTYDQRNGRVFLDGRKIGNVWKAEEGWTYFSFPILHIDRRATSFYRALLACVQDYCAWIGNHGRL